MSINEKLGTSVTIDTLDGPKIYTFNKLRALDNQRVYFDTVQTLLSAVSGMAGDAKGVDLSSLGETIRSLEFDKFHALAKKLLKGAHVKPDADNLLKIVSLTDLDNCDYFNDFPEELYLAVFHALKVNYPKSFSRLAAKLGAFGQKVGAEVGKQFGTQ